jgi:GDP-L-fucose synthase
MHRSKYNQTVIHVSDNEVIVWGTGLPRREFLYSDDMAEACVFLMNLPDDGFDSVLDPRPTATAVTRRPP